MRSSAHQSVAGWLLAAALGCALGCDQAGSASPDPGPSPLLSADADHLWILLWARGDMEPSCGRFYAQPDDPRYAGQRSACERWEASALEILRENGIREADASDLRDGRFWDWYRGRAAQISQCSADSLQAPGLSASKQLVASLACDPYLKLTRVEKRRVQDVGIRVP